MEEVDGIIIESLKHIKCDLDENIASLRDFTEETVFSAIVYCLETITPGIKCSHKLPQSMSLRLKVATNIAEHIKRLGYRGDMGYQTILYCNEAEIRRVLMFLVERLPRDTSKTTAPSDVGYVSKLVKEIEERVRLSFDQFWVPSTLLKHGVRECESLYLKQDCSHCFSLQTESICIPKVEDTVTSEHVRQYWVRNLSEVTHQCSSRSLIPSLLYKDSEFSLLPVNSRYDLTNHVNGEVVAGDEFVEPVKVELSKVMEEGLVADNQIEKTVEEISGCKAKYDHLKAKYKSLGTQLTLLNDEKESKEASLKEILTKGKTKTKALAVASNKENVVKLKGLIETGNKRLVELANQWSQVQTPLLERYKELQVNSNKHESQVLSAQQKLQNLKEKNQQMAVELQEKEKIESQLVKEYEKLYKNTHRSAYTRRILEIIANIKKQNEDIQKVLIDTKSIQKEINNLNGQLDRSFLLSDELIFRDAKRNDMSRRAYKMLANLHSDFGYVIQAVTDLGLVERECRNIQEQIDAEMTREVFTKLEKVNADLVEIKKETAALINQLTQQN